MATHQRNGYRSSFCEGVCNAEYTPSDTATSGAERQSQLRTSHRVVSTAATTTAQDFVYTVKFGVFPEHPFLEETFWGVEEHPLGCSVSTLGVLS